MDNQTLAAAPDSRQFPQWATMMRSIGWTVETVNQVQIFIRQIPIFHHSLIKIEHPIGPIPFQEIDLIAKKYKALFVLIEPHLANYDSEQYHQHGYQISRLRSVHSATIKIDLTKTQSQLLESFSENARRNIKKAEKNQLRIETINLATQTDDHAFQQFWQLFENLGKMKKFYTTSYDQQYKKMLAFQKTSYLLFAYAPESEEPVATVWLAYHDKLIFYVQTGITERGYQLLANYLLVWEAFKLAQSLDLDVFDFESIFDPRYPKQNKRIKGYTQFKKRFHGAEVYYPSSWIKFYNLPYKLLYLCATIFSK